MSKRIGILGGISAESTVRYYDRIIKGYFERRQGYHYPEVVIFSLNFQRFTDYEDKGDKARLIRKHCRIDAEREQMLERSMVRPGLSARAYDRILKVSRTIADLECSVEIRSQRVAEAVGHRSLDRTYWV